MATISHHVSDFDIPSLDEQNGNTPGLAPFDADFGDWIDEHQQPITPEEDEAAYRQWQLDQIVAANIRPVKVQYFMVALKGKDKGWFEIRRDSDGECVGMVRGKPEAKREVERLNAA